MKDLLFYLLFGTATLIVTLYFIYFHNPAPKISGAQYLCTMEKQMAVCRANATNFKNKVRKFIHNHNIHLTKIDKIVEQLYQEELEKILEALGKGYNVYYKKGEEKKIEKQIEELANREVRRLGRLCDEVKEELKAKSLSKS